MFSLPSPAASGFIKGLMLGPVLFGAFMDLLFAISSHTVSAYIDKVKLIENVADASCADIQSNVNKIKEWSTAMFMTLQHVKCLVLHCGINNPNRTYVCKG